MSTCLFLYRAFRLSGITGRHGTFRKPQSPSNLDEPDEDERQKDLELYRRRHTHFYYVGATAAKLDTHYKAMEYDRGLFRKKIYQHAAAPWEGNSIPLKVDILQVVRDWSEFTPTDPATDATAPPCPMSIEEQDAADTIEKILEQEDIDRKMGILHGFLGIGSDGWVSCERYDDIVQAAAAMKVKALGYADDDVEREMTKVHWPFDDFDEEG